MGIPKRMMITIGGLAFTGATALMIGTAAPATAATSATPTGTTTVTATPTWWDGWALGDDPSPTPWEWWRWRG